MKAPKTGLPMRFCRLSKRIQVLVCFVISVPLYLLYITGLTENPPAFYVDESAVSYNALTIYLWGQGDSGHSWPLFFPVYPYPRVGYLGYADPVQIYLLAALYNIFPPSEFLSRAVDATAMFLAAILLGALARSLSNNSSFVGITVALTALLTPWLYEIGRLAFAAGLYPLTVVLLLLALYAGYRKVTWSLLDQVLIALSLALTTYTYAIGRLLGPLFAFGLLLFARDLKRLKGVLMTWIFYGIALVPMLVFDLRNPGALTGRFTMSVGYISKDMGLSDMLAQFSNHYLANISLQHLFVDGDPIVRHHVLGAPPLLAVTLFFAGVGILIILVKHRRDPLWQYIVYGLLVSIVPASLTHDEFHFLRLSAFPVFVLVLTIPTLTLLVKGPGRTVGDRWPRLRFVSAKPFRYVSLTLLLIAALTQAIVFQIYFWEVGSYRGAHFDSNFPMVLDAALEQPERPIYLVDECFYHAFWQAALRGIDTSIFVRLRPEERPPANSIVLSTEVECSMCDVILQNDPYIIYKTLADVEQPLQLPSDSPPDMSRNIDLGDK